MRRVLALGLLVVACSSPKPAQQPPPAGDAGAATSTQVTAAEMQSSSTASTAGAPPGPIPLAECPISIFDTEPPERTLDRLVEQAEASFDDQRLPEAFTCADQAVDLAPDSVEAHHLRGAALAALGHDQEAELAYTMALALDPDDPETLRAVADFYLNVRAVRDRDTALLALELARRGRARATARRRGSAALRADLALLEAQSLNDLGRSDEALDHAKEALRLEPSLIDAVHERGVALYNLGRFGDARAAFTEVLGQLPDDAYAHHFLGLTLEQLGQRADADAHFRRARELAPDDFPAPIVISVEEFQREIDEVVGELPPETKAKLLSVPVQIVDAPSRDDLDAVDPPFPPNILGLFRGLPHGIELPVAPGARPVPRAILLYRLNLARAVRSRDELSEQIRRTLLHEIGHLEGLDEDDLRRRGLDYMVVPLSSCRACGGELATATPTGLCATCRDDLGLHHRSAPAQRPRTPCARCNGRQIIRARVRDASSLGLHSAALTSDVRAEGTVDLSRQRGMLEAYTCRRCGFTEWYAQEPEDIPIGPAYGTELIDLDEDGGPYR